MAPRAWFRPQGDGRRPAPSADGPISKQPASSAAYRCDVVFGNRQGAAQVGNVRHGCRCRWPIGESRAVLRGIHIRSSSISLPPRNGRPALADCDWRTNCEIGGAPFCFFWFAYVQQKARALGLLTAIGSPFAPCVAGPRVLTDAARFFCLLPTFKRARAARRRKGRRHRNFCNGSSAGRGLFPMTFAIDRGTGQQTPDLTWRGARPRAIIVLNEPLGRRPPRPRPGGPGGPGRSGPPPVGRPEGQGACLRGARRHIVTVRPLKGRA